jgi:hypothetical protein
VTTTYSISVEDGVAIPLTSDEVGTLEEAMDILAPSVADVTFPDGGRVRRRLSVKVTLPTTVTGLIDDGKSFISALSLAVILFEELDRLTQLSCWSFQHVPTELWIPRVVTMCLPRYRLL